MPAPLRALRSFAPHAHKGYPQPSALRLCSPTLRVAFQVGDSPPLALATLTGVGQGQGVSITDTAIQFKSNNRR
jgi:hypothetical protein